MQGNKENQEAITPDDVIFPGIYKNKEITWFSMKKASLYLVKIADEFYLCIERINQGLDSKNDCPCGLFVDYNSHRTVNP